MIQKLLSTVLKRVIIVVLGLIILSCGKDQENHEKMISILAEIQQSNFNKTNPFCPEAEIAFYPSLNGLDQNIRRSNVAKHQLAMAYLKAGEEQKAVEILEKLIPKAIGQFPTEGNFMRGSLAIANMRLGERQNCVRNHTSESCVIPIVNTGVHTIQTGSRRAIEVYQEILKNDPEEYEARWLLNIAYMTLGEYPGGGLIYLSTSVIARNKIPSTSGATPDERPVVSYPPWE